MKASTSRPSASGRSPSSTSSTQPTPRPSPVRLVTLEGATRPEIERLEGSRPRRAPPPLSAFSTRRRSVGSYERPRGKGLSWWHCAHGNGVAMPHAISRRALAKGALLAPLALVGCSGETPADPDKDGTQAQGLARRARGAAPPSRSPAPRSSRSTPLRGAGSSPRSRSWPESLLVVPEGEVAPEGLEDGVAVVRQPLENGVDPASTGMICLVDAIGALDQPRASPPSRPRTPPSPPSPSASRRGPSPTAASTGSPDYELISANRLRRFAIENTNIDHVPEVRAKLEELGVTVLTGAVEPRGGDARPP